MSENTKAIQRKVYVAGSHSDIQVLFQGVTLTAMSHLFACMTREIQPAILR